MNPILLALTAGIFLLGSASVAQVAPNSGEAAVPGSSAEVSPFVAKMDDQQARALLVRVLEARVPSPEPERNVDMLVAFERATGVLADRWQEIAGGWGEVVAAPSLFWRWLTAGGSDPSAPWRAGIGAVLVIAIGWAAQLAVSYASRALTRPWRAAGRSAHRVSAAVMLVRSAAFLGTVAAVHALVPEGSHPSRLTGLALVLMFVGSWIASRIVSDVLPALLATDGRPAGARLRERWLGVAFGIFFAGLFGLALLREAGLPTDPRLLIGLAVWLAFGVVFLLAFRWRRGSPARTPVAGAQHLDPIERLLERHGAVILRLSLVAIFAGTALMALIWGPSAFWSGMASLALLGLLVAALGLTRSPTQPPVEGQAIPPSAWAATLRRTLRILSLVGFAVALSSLWRIDLFHTASTQLGERVVRGIITVAITVVLSYLVWELTRTALAQSILGSARPEAERGEEGGGSAATRLQTFAPVLRNLLFVVVLTVATMVCLSSLGVDIAPLLAGAGVIGIAMGFGAQTLVRDIISGIFFLAEDAFRTGEYVEIGNTRGTVEGIAIRSLKLRHHRGAVHTVPFGEIKQLTNYSRDWMIIKLEFLVAFDTDLRKVKNIVKEIDKELQTHPELGHALLEPIKSQGVRRMEPTGMVVGLKFMGKPGSEVFVLRREVYQRVRDAFEANGIQFARPQVTVAGPPGSMVPPDQVAAAAALGEPPRLASSAG